jgi:hypothetical protein
MARQKVLDLIARYRVWHARSGFSRTTILLWCKLLVYCLNDLEVPYGNDYDCRKQRGEMRHRKR